MSVADATAEPGIATFSSLSTAGSRSRIARGSRYVLIEDQLSGGMSRCAGAWPCAGGSRERGTLALQAVTLSAPLIMEWECERERAVLMVASPCSALPGSARTDLGGWRNGQAGVVMLPDTSRGHRAGPCCARPGGGLAGDSSIVLHCPWPQPSSGPGRGPPASPLLAST